MSIITPVHAVISWRMFPPTTLCVNEPKGNDQLTNNGVTAAVTPSPAFYGKGRL
jgi:hypothetical protein